MNPGVKGSGIIFSDWANNSQVYLPAVLNRLTIPASARHFEKINLKNDDKHGKMAKPS